MKQDMTL